MPIQWILHGILSNRCIHIIQRESKLNRNKNLIYLNYIWHVTFPAMVQHQPNIVNSIACSYFGNSLFLAFSEESDKWLQQMYVPEEFIPLEFALLLLNSTKSTRQASNQALSPLGFTDFWVSMLHVEFQSLVLCLLIRCQCAPKTKTNERYFSLRSWFLNFQNETFSHDTHSHENSVYGILCFTFIISI